MEIVGISANASIFATYPLFTSIVAVSFLGETLTVENWMGLASVIVGVIFVGRILSMDHKQSQHTSKKGLMYPYLVH